MQPQPQAQTQFDTEKIYPLIDATNAINEAHHNINMINNVISFCDDFTKLDSLDNHTPRLTENPEKLKIKYTGIVALIDMIYTYVADTVKYINIANEYLTNQYNAYQDTRSVPFKQTI